MKDATDEHELTLKQLGISQMHEYKFWLSSLASDQGKEGLSVGEFPAISALWEDIGKILQMNAEMLGVSQGYQEGLVSNPWFRKESNNPASSSQSTAKNKYNSEAVQQDLATKRQEEILNPGDQQISSQLSNPTSLNPIHPNLQMPKSGFDTVGMNQDETTVSKPKFPDWNGNSSLNADNENELIRARENHNVKFPELGKNETLPVVKKQAKEALPELEDGFLPKVRGLNDFAGLIKTEQNASPTTNEYPPSKEDKLATIPSIESGNNVSDINPPSATQPPHSSIFLPEKPQNSSIQRPTSLTNMWGKLEDQINALYPSEIEKSSQISNDNPASVQPITQSKNQVENGMSEEVQKRIEPTISAENTINNPGPLNPDLKTISSNQHAETITTDEPNLLTTETDVEDLFEALSEQLSREYKRYYGS